MANGSADKFSKLPELAKPSLYEIRLAPCLKTYKLKGTEKIHLEITKPTNFLKLNSKTLEMEKVSLKLADGTVFADLKTEIDKKWELLTLHLPKEVQPQKAELDFVFNGELGLALEGFYRSPYKDAKGQEKFMASTQFESTYARKAFPCWDEPTYKAQFDVQLEVAEPLTALSNMNVVKEEPTGQGTKVVSFARTPVMSSYLVAFAVGEFEYLESKNKDGIVVRVYTMPGKKEMGKYSLEVAVKSLDYYTDWYGIKQPLPKCDLIGIPEFAMGAMENWGLITFREVNVLFDPRLTSSATKQRVTLVVAHEVGHFWFGNLVTMKWWCDLWLKEGFASFMEYKFTADNYPEFNIWLNFVTMEMSRAINLDSMRSSHPIEVTIDNPCELDEIYDAITYGKSNSIIRMLFNYLGEPTFQKGLRIYLDKHKYSNAETKDLWQSLSEASGIDVNGLMSSWTSQMGFPLVTVSEKQLEGNRRELHCQQCRYLEDGSVDDNRPLWQIPIPVAASEEPAKTRAKFLLTKTEDTFVVENIKPEEWLKVNAGYTSFVRVRYSDEMFKRLLEGIKNGRMDVLDRLQIAYDLFAFVRSGHVPITQFLEYLEFCGGEDILEVWEAIDSGLAAIDHVLAYAGDQDALKNRFHQFVCKNIETVAARYGWEPKPNEDMNTSQLRALLIKRLAQFNHLSTNRTALAKFNDYASNRTQLDSDLRQTIFGVAARSNDPKMIEDLQKIMANCNFSEIERGCVMALGACSDPKLLAQIYQKGIKEKSIKSQDVIYLFMVAYASANAATQKFAWDYFTQNQDFFVNLWGSQSSNLYMHCLKATGKSFCTEAGVEEFQNFCKANYDENILKTLDRPILQVVETVKMNAQLLQNSMPGMDTYLKNAGF